MTTLRLAGVEVPRVGLGTNRLIPTDANLAFVLPGTLSIDHLRENLAALDLELDDGDLAAIG